MLSQAAALVHSTAYSQPKIKRDPSRALLDMCVFASLFDPSPGDAACAAAATHPGNAASGTRATKPLPSAPPRPEQKNVVGGCWASGNEATNPHHTTVGDESPTRRGTNKANTKCPKMPPD